MKTLSNQFKNSLYKAVSKYIHETHILDDAKRDIKKIVCVAKKQGFIVEDRSTHGMKSFALLYNGVWYVDFFIRDYDNKVNVQINENELLTGKELEDHIKHENEIAIAEIEAERKMSLYNSGYRDY